jgi:RNA polymerase sigma-70 factor (ECF subfamily)
MIVSDEDLAKAAAGGDREAFSALLVRRYDGLFGLCFRLTGARAEAEDLCQDICAALPAKLRSYQGGSRFTTWLYRVAVNASHDRRRKRMTHIKHSENWGDWEIARQADNAHAAARINWLQTAMNSLPNTLRDTIALVLDDMTHHDVAEILGISEGTVSWRISEVKKHLKQLKEKEDAQ